MPRHEIIDEITYNPIWLASEAIDNSANKQPGITVPLEVDGPRGTAIATKLCPSVWPPLSLLLRGDQTEISEFGILNDLVPE